MDRETEKTIRIIPSKSYAHRAYICDFLAGGNGEGVACDLDSEDIMATRSCLSGLGCTSAVIDARESGSTLRFILPLSGVLGKSVSIRTRGRLSDRPMGPFEEELVSHGMKIEHLSDGIIKTSGKLMPGEYRLPGSISSQFITGLLLSLPYLDGDSRILLTSELQSSAYVDITIDVLKEYWIRIENSSGDGHGGFLIRGRQKYHRDKHYTVEGDWSQAAFWLTAGAIGEIPVRVTGLNLDSVQGDRKIIDVLRTFGAEIKECREDDGTSVTAYPSDLTGAVVDVSGIPDLAPAIACAGAASSGETKLINAGRLRLKESDRIKSITACLNDVGVKALEREDEIIIEGGGSPQGGAAETSGDHRIVMMAAVLSLITSDKVKIEGSGAVSKSYPTFFKELEQAGLSGNIILS
ncbi:MAG: 3-phosphoshikimate 1-carboxyvinyltransferase [Eubacterium sp.]|nr:3-phosphoshikimate 1-carboxyvinyltransferase [Eubacterium sp.]